MCPRLNLRNQILCLSRTELHKQSKNAEGLPVVSDFRPSHLRSQGNGGLRRIRKVKHTHPRDVGDSTSATAATSGAPTLSDWAAL
jgi:hypothetical protein